jgi:DNA-binding XRE family transcriptional regulator
VLIPFPVKLVHRQSTAEGLDANVALGRQIDIHLGQRLRQRRRLLGLTQGQLARACGLRFQQIQKYECGATRLSASRLWQLAAVLTTPISYFFEEAGGAEPPIP